MFQKDNLMIPKDSLFLDTLPLEWTSDEWSGIPFIVLLYLALKETVPTTGLPSHEKTKDAWPIQAIGINWSGTTVRSKNREKI